MSRIEKENVLVGSTHSESAKRLIPQQVDIGYDVRLFGPGTSTFYEIGEDIQALLSKLPKGKKPPLLVWFGPEYIPFPLENLPEIHTVGIYGDAWHNPSVARDFLRAFDVVVADPLAQRSLEAYGAKNVITSLLWSPDIQHFEGANEVDKSIDIVFAGGMFSHIWTDRNRMLGELVKALPERKIQFRTGIYGEEYAKFLASGKIVFNVSVLGTPNMRLLEGALAGSLVVTNRIEDSPLRDGIECVMFDDVDDAREKIDFYLRNDDRRTNIARAGWKKAQEFTPWLNLKRIIDGATTFLTISNAGATWRQIPEHRKHFIMARYALSTSYQDWQRAFINSQQALDLVPNEEALGEYANVRAVTCFLQAYKQLLAGNQAGANNFFSEAFGLWGELRARGSNNALVWLNSGYAYSVTGFREQAVAVLSETMGRLKEDSFKINPEGLRLKTVPDSTFPFVWEQIVLRHAGDDKKTHEELRRVMIWECAMLLGGLYVAGGNLPEAKRVYVEAIGINPGLGETYSQFGLVCEELGLANDAICAYKKALDFFPWDFDVRKKLIILCKSLHMTDEAAKIGEVGINLARSAPSYNNEIAQLQELILDVRLYEPY